jgi:RNA polymerase sigma-70 factor (ECF subfamily)
VRRWGASALILSHGWLALSAFARWSPKPRSDASLVRRARAGDGLALEQLIDRYWSEVARAALAIVRDRQGAEDAAQETMIALTRNLDRYDQARPFRPWLHRIAVNKAFDQLRAEKRRPDPIEVTETASAPAPVEEGESPELIEALGSLAPEDRAIVFYRHGLGYRSGEIGELLDMPPATVRTRLARAMPRLRSQMEAGGDDDA